MKGTCIFFLFAILVNQARAQSIFTDLSAQEVENVISYLMEQPDLRIVAGEDVTIGSSYIYAIEALQPNKAEALNFLDNDGRIPTKKAKVIIMRGDATPPVVQEYAVYPLPNPTTHTLLKYEYTRDPIPHHARSANNPPDEEAFLALLRKEVAKVDDILVAITGISYANCGEDDDCLTWSFGGPSEKSGNRSLIFSILRDFEGWPIHPIGLECLMLMPGVDVRQWEIVWVSFRGTSFPSFDAMRVHFQNATPKPDQNQPIDDENLPSSQHFRGLPRPAEAKRGPRSSYPDGPRYTVKDNHVEWMGWSLDFGMPTTSGPRLHDIRFLGERIAYEISMQQTAVFYTGSSAFFSHTRYFDGFYNAGTTYSRMMPGVDCPLHAHFADTVHYFQGEVTTFKDTICIFELDKGIPLRRHYSTDYEGGYYFYNGIPDNVLVFRTILTVDNYDYIYDFMFHQGGQIEIKVSLSGYILTYYSQSKDDNKYGFHVGEPTSLGTLHSHAVNYKIDLDVKGTKNRFRTLEIGLHQYPDPIDNRRMIVNKFINESVKQTEREAAYKYNFNTPKYLVVSNEDSKNKFGNERGYRILNHAMYKQLEDPESFGGKARSWADYQVAITKRKESEPFSSSPHVFMDQDEAVVNFQDFIDDNENIVGEDLVAWVTIGSQHIPIAEDIPIVQTTGAQPTFYLIPFNYFDEDPSLASRDNIRVEPGEKAGQHTYRYSGVPGDKVCAERGITCEGTVKKTTDDDKDKGEEPRDQDCPKMTSSAEANQMYHLAATVCICFFYYVCSMSDTLL